MSMNARATVSRLSRPLRRPLVAALVAAALAACGEDDLVAKAREAIARGDDAAASVFLRSALQQQSGAADVRIMFADLLERRHDRAGAEEQLRKALEGGGNADVLVPRIALLMVDRGDMETLIRTYKDEHLQDPQAEATLRGTVALALLSLKREAPARQQIEGAPPVPAVRLARAQLLVNEGQAAQALAELGLDDAESPPPWWLLRAARRIAVAAGEPELSLDLIRRAQAAAPWNLGVVGEYGEALVSAGRFDDATQVRDRLAKAAPQFFWTHYLSALLFNRAGRLDEAHAAALSVLKVSPDHAASALIAASAELRSDDVRVAYERLLPLVRRNPQSLPAVRLLAQAQLRMGQIQPALETVERGLRLAPGDAELLLMRGRIDTAAGRPKEAVSSYEKAAATRPDEPDVLLALARARAAAGNRNGARQLLERLPDLVDDGAQGARLVETVLSLREPDWARRIAERLLARFPADAQARLAGAAVKSIQGDAAGAWQAVLAVLDDDRRNGGALMALGTMARTPAQREKLLARHAAALAAGGGGPSQLLAYAALLRDARSADPSPASVLERAVKLHPTSVPLRQALVDESMRQGQASQAIGLAESGAAMADAPAAARELLGNTYLRVGKTQQAGEVYRKLAQDFPQHTGWRQLLAQLDARTGQVSEAKSTLRKLVGDRPFDPSAYVMLAHLEAPDNLAEALSVAQQLQARPEFRLTAMLLTGDVYLQAGKADDAIEAFTAAGKAGAQPAASLRIVDALDRADRAEQAERAMARLLREQPEHAEVLGFAARRAQQAGRASEAVGYLQRLARRNPDNPILLNDLAWAQIAAGQPAALANARKALRAMPNDPNVLDTAGVAMAMNGLLDESATTLRAAVNLAPTRSLARLHLADVLVTKGDRTGAAAALKALDEDQLGARDKELLARLKSAVKDVMPAGSS